MAEPDFFDAVQAGREALRRLQESFARYTLPPEQRQALADGMSQLVFPTDGVRAMSDLIDAFGPPLAQIESLRDELAEQREQLSQLDDRLAHLEASAERLAIASEQLAAFQEPFVRMASLMTGQDLRARAAGEDEQDGEDQPSDPTDDGSTASAGKPSTAKKSTAKNSTAKNSTAKKSTAKKKGDKP
ncbi:MAG: hypothetical protein OEV40_03040 [Acidimicrobiia bacterium]|nr:hypothetical protein [Acidimicrobiia bacterium]